jgi:2-octaprenyl-6-methoxyphenol hydroxylase
MPERSKVDIVIAGGGYVGLGLALALRQADAALRVRVIDARPEDAHAADERASAIAHGARNLLDQLGVWSELEPHAQAIEDMIVTDSKLGDKVRPVFLTFAERTPTQEPFAHMVPNGRMVGALRSAALASGVSVMSSLSVTDFTRDPGGIVIELSDATRMRARLLVAADGVRSRLRDLAGIKCTRWDYGQSGIVTTVAHTKPHNGRAEEHFLPSGPFAILPLKGNRSSIVWTEARIEADRIVSEDPFVFQLELERRFGRHLGDIEVVGTVQSYPLGLTLARDFVQPSLALVGDAAHGIHPISGQGLNMGFRDIAALAQVVVEARRLGEDIGSLSVLRRYQLWRRFDTFQMGVVTDVLNRLFSNNIDPIRLIRDIGLGIVDRLPRLKSALIAEAKGASGDPPRLLRGEPI